MTLAKQVVSVVTLPGMQAITTAMSMEVKELNASFPVKVQAMTNNPECLDDTRANIKKYRMNG